MDIGCHRCRPGTQSVRHTNAARQKPSRTSVFVSTGRRRHSLILNANEGPLPPLSTIPKPGMRPSPPARPSPPPSTPSADNGGENGSEPTYGNRPNGGFDARPNRQYTRPQQGPQSPRENGDGGPQRSARPPPYQQNRQPNRSGYEGGGGGGAAPGGGQRYNQGQRPQNGQGQYQGNRYQGNQNQGNQYQGNQSQGGQYQGNQYQGNQNQGGQYQGNQYQGGQYQGNQYQNSQNRSYGQQQDRPPPPSPNQQLSPPTSGQTPERPPQAPSPAPASDDPTSASLLNKPALNRPDGLMQRPELKRPVPPPRPPTRYPQGPGNFAGGDVSRPPPPGGRYPPRPGQGQGQGQGRYPQQGGQQQQYRPQQYGDRWVKGTPYVPPPPPTPQQLAQQQQQDQQQQNERNQQQQQQQAPGGAPQPGGVKFVVVEGDEDEDGKKKGKGKFVRGKGKEGGRAKVTAAMKREARKSRKADRDSKRVVEEKEEIFEVGDEGLSVIELADMLQINLSDVIMALFMKGIVCTANQQLDRNTVKLVAKDYDVLVLDKEEVKVTDKARKKKEAVLEDEDLENMVPRPPVVTVMGHVDHGKTSLLDYIRKSRVAAGEAGGITQQIGAYTTEVEVEGEQKTICFLDTPGHEAFSAMRARGASVTDVAVIIVAADDGVQPQTKEAISHAQAAGVPILVAINKVDKPGADVERTKSGLTQCNLVPEEWGGSTPMVSISAKTGEGMEDLMLNIVLLAEECGLMANPNRPAAGTVIEAHLDRKSGPVTNVLVQTGTLKLGDVVRAGASYGKVKSLSNDLGKNLPYAGPSIAVQILGLSSVPQAGDEFEVCSSEAEARKTAEEFGERMRELRLAEMSAGGSMVTLSSLATIDEDVDVLQKLNLVVKGDTQGVVEAIKVALSSLPQDSVMLRFLWAGAGEITQADVDLAAASKGLLLAFNLSPSEAVLTSSKRLGVEVRSYKVIYDLIDDVRAAMEGKLASVEQRTEIGKAEVKAVFGSGTKKVAGCMVLEGRLRKGCLAVVSRKKEGVVWEGPLSSLRRVKDTVDEVPAGQECGIGSDGFTDWKEGDIVTAVESIMKSRTLEEAKVKSVSLADDKDEEDKEDEE